MQGGPKIPCGWTGCPEFFASVADMNRHVQFNHMQYKVEVTVVPFNPSLSLPRTPTTIPQLEDVKPSMEPGSALNPLLLESDEIFVPHASPHSGTSSTSSCMRCVSSYMENLKSRQKCAEPSCDRTFASRQAAQRHFNKMHRAENWTWNEDSIASTSSRKCQRRGCKKVFPTEEEADNHFHLKHLNGRSFNFEEEDDDSVKQEPKKRRKRAKKEVPESVESTSQGPDTVIPTNVEEEVPVEQIKEQVEEQYYTVDDDHCYYNKNIPE